MGNQHFTSAIKHLNWSKGSPDFNAFIDALVLSERSSEQRTIEPSVWDNVDFERVFLAFFAFKGAWNDRSNDPEKKAKFEMDYGLKIIINKKLQELEDKIYDRQYILLKRKALEEHNQLKKLALQEHNEKKAQELAQFNFLSQTLLEELDMNACIAIQNYQSSRHKKVKVLSKIENNVTAVSFGFAESMISVTALIASLTGAKVTWNILSYLVGSLCGLVSWMASLNTGEPYMFTTFNKLFGEGSIRYYYCKATKRYEKLTNTQMVQLGFFALIAAIVGLGSGGAVAYTSFLGLSTLPYLIGLAGISAACPPIGIAFAAFVVVGTFCTLIANFYNKLLIAGHPKQGLCDKIYHFIKKPFDELKEVINSWNIQNSIKKKLVAGGCYFFTICFCLVGVVALGISSWNNVNSFTKFGENIFSAGPKVAKMLGIIVGGVINGVGRVVFVLSSAITCFKTVLNRAGKEISRSGFVVSVLETITRLAFSMITFERNGGQDLKTSSELGGVTACRTFIFNTAQIIKDIKPESPAESDDQRIKDLTKIAETNLQGTKITQEEEGVYTFKKTYLKLHPKSSFRNLIKGKKVVNMGLFHQLATEKPKVGEAIGSMHMSLKPAQNLTTPM